VASSLIRLACVLADDLPIQIERQRQPVELPLLITNPTDAGLVFACSPETRANGVHPGMSVYQARQRVPHALVVPPDEPTFHAAHVAVELALRDYCPALETLGLGAFLMDIRAISALHGGDEELALALVAAAQNASGLTVRAGVGSGRFVAEQAARHAHPRGGLVVAPDTEAQFLARLPISVLPNLPGHIIHRLDILDLHTLGDLAALSKAAVMRQFGGEIGPHFELARGKDPRPLRPDVPPLRLESSLQFDEPTRNREGALLAVQDLAGQLAEQLNDRGYHAESITLRIELTGDTVLEDGQAVKPPTADKSHLSRLAVQLFKQLRPRKSISRLALSVYPLRSWHLSAHQGELVRAGISDKRVSIERTLLLLIHRFTDRLIRVGALLGPPIPLRIRVKLNAAGQPALLIYGSLARPVQDIHERWREEQQLWDKDCVARRDCYRVILADGTYRKIYLDLVSERWYLDRRWPLL
jgi:nucleotidyltransferase/DNA polymerase involved in DNA repair